MKIIRTSITIRELVEGYTDYTDVDIEKGVFAYGGKLCVRPPFQRSFVYSPKEENAVIDTALKGFPLNIMYWVDNEDGTYNCLDGQQRTISLGKFYTNKSSFIAPWMPVPSEHYPFSKLQRISPDLIENFLNYELEVYICQGTKDEQLEWFKVINIAGQKLYPQELRNTGYTGKWLTDAKRYFSKANSSSTAKCPAENVGGDYTNKNANRQELLEQVMSWITDNNDKRDKETENNDICQYMEDHMYDENANELWEYFNNVINWIKKLFPGDYDSGMKSVNWGRLYNKYKDDLFDPDEIHDEFVELMDFKASKELDVSVAKIVEYCITQDKSLLKHRAFSETQRTALYNRQKGICPDCNKHYIKSEMHAHHITPWYNGGLTELNNGVMLCKECHTQRHL